MHQSFDIEKMGAKSPRMETSKRPDSKRDKASARMKVQTARRMHALHLRKDKLQNRWA